MNTNKIIQKIVEIVTKNTLKLEPNMEISKAQSFALQYVENRLEGLEKRILSQTQGSVTKQLVHHLACQELAKEYEIDEKSLENEGETNNYLSNNILKMLGELPNVPQKPEREQKERIIPQITQTTLF
jgi:hypothetical protein